MKGILNKLLGRSGSSPLDKESWRARIEPTSDKAFELAVARWDRGAPLDEQRTTEARRLQEELRRASNELRDKYPDLYQSFSETISEALLDLKYAISAPKAISLRLNHYIESKEGTRK